MSRCLLRKLWSLCVPGFTQLTPQIITLCFQLLERLTSKGKRQPEFTRELIKNKLTDDEDGIATTNLKVWFDQAKISLSLFNIKLGDCELPPG